LATFTDLRFAPLALIAFAPSCDRSPPPARNAVVILLDTCRYDEVGRTTRQGPVTPSLDAFADGATRFTKATSPAPWTLPAVATLLTSAHPTVHGAKGHYPDFTGLRDVPTGAEGMARSGVRTCAIVNCPFLDPVLGLGRGFDRFDYYADHGPEIRTAGDALDAALDWVRENRDERFFLFVHLFDAHMDYEPAEPFRSRFLEGEPRPFDGPFAGVGRWRRSGASSAVRRYARALYRAEIAAIDDAIGSFLADLEGLGVIEETAVVITSDHGEEFWEHGQFEHGHTLYEELLHVPLIVRAPGRATTPEVRARVGLIDVMPTLYELLALPPVESFEGRSLVPLLDGRTPSGPRNRFSESILYGPERKAVTSERFKFIRCKEDGTRALFDLEQDPGEARNLMEEEPERAREMESQLDDWERLEERRAQSTPAAGVIDMEKDVMSKLRSLGYAD
jgi:arylsulfatase A-like enzyme